MKLQNESFSQKSAFYSLHSKFNVFQYETNLGVWYLLHAKNISLCMACHWVIRNFLHGELVPQYPYLLVVTPLVAAQAHTEATLYPAAPPIRIFNILLHLMLVSSRSHMITEDQGAIYNFNMLDLYGRILQ